MRVLEFLLLLATIPALLFPSGVRGCWCVCPGTVEIAGRTATCDRGCCRETDRKTDRRGPVVGAHCPGCAEVAAQAEPSTRPEPGLDALASPPVVVFLPATVPHPAKRTSRDFIFRPPPAPGPRGLTPLLI